jgi:hypothetical protein
MEATMKAEIDDELVVRSPHLDVPARSGRIVEIHGADGAPPYLVRWSDSGRTGLVFPGPDAEVRHASMSGGEHRSP